MLDDKDFFMFLKSIFMFLYPPWMQNKEFITALKAFQSACNQVKFQHSDPEIEGVFKKWGKEKKKSKKNNNRRSR